MSHLDFQRGGVRPGGWFDRVVTPQILLGGRKVVRMRWTNIVSAGARLSKRVMGKQALAGLGLLAAGVMGAGANAQCIGYSAAPGTASFVAGTDDIGLNADDQTLTISLPFNVTFYGSTYSSVTVSSNGNLQFGAGTPSVAYANDCLPSLTFAGPTLCVFWDDLYTVDTAGGQGVFTGTSGAAGSRVFVIEWRTVYCCGVGSPANVFEAKFYENSNSFDLVYSSTMADRGSATIGCQLAGAAGSVSTVFECNAAGPAPGDSVHFECTGSATAGACCIASNLSCLFTDAAGCGANNGTFSGVGTACATANCPFGACCVFCAGCSLQSTAACSTLGGTYQGNSSSCGATSCSGAGANLLTNADFESGSFSGWTQFGDTSFTAVNTGAWVGISPHGGTFQAHFGPTVGLGGIQQNVIANPGDQVTISFWYAAVGTPNSFSADFDGQNLVTFTNDVDHGAWTSFVFTATVTSVNPLMSFTMTNPPSYDFLDDISVCARNVTNGACCNNAAGGCTSTTQADCASGSTFQGLGTACQPNPCPQPPSGVCCRGSTCTTTITTNAACHASLIPGQNAGSSFAISGACNTTGTYTTPCCYANYNKLNGISVQDIFDYLQDWFAGSPFAGTGGNGTGGLSTQNIFDFLQAWFSGGCS